MTLPDVPNATVLESIEKFSQLCDEEKWLIGFCCNGGSAQPKNVSGRHNFNSWNKDKNRIANNLYKIGHWEIKLGNYWEIENTDATWFVDPPYSSGGGKWYKYNHVDYEKLGEWCKSRKGQVIACEAGEANWLPFVHFKDIPFTHFKSDLDYSKRTNELIWYKES